MFLEVKRERVRKLESCFRESILIASYLPGHMMPRQAVSDQYCGSKADYSLVFAFRKAPSGLRLLRRRLLQFCTRMAFLLLLGLRHAPAWL